MPFTGSILKSGFRVFDKEITKVSKPLKADKIIIKAALPTKTPNIEIPEMILMALVDFFEKRYLLAM